MTEAPRLVHIAEFDRPHPGSFVPLLAGVLRSAAESGWRTEAILPEPAGRTDWADEIREVADLRLAPESALRSRGARAAWLRGELARDRSPTVVHTHFTRWDVPALLAVRGRTRAETALFWHIHSALSRNPVIVARSSVKFGLLGRGVSGIICPAPNIALGVKQRLAPAGRVHFLPSALDPDLYPLASEADRAAARAELELEAGARVILHFGWHEYLKGTDLFLRMLSELATGDDRVLGLVRGHEESSVEEARRLGLGEHVRFQPPVDIAAKLFAAADVVVSSSRDEGMAYTVLESLASGTPVVATAIPGHAFVGEEVAACRITSTDIGALARTTAEVLAEPPDERAAQAASGREWIVSNLSVEVISERLLSLYREELPAAPAPSPRPAPNAPVRNATPRVIQMAEFANSRPGSFVPMLASASAAVTERGWRAEAILGEDSAGRPWVESLRNVGARVRFAPSVGRDGIRRWLGEVFDESDGPVVLHTHFTGFDISAAIASMSDDRVRVIWHVHSSLSTEPAIVARNLVKFGVIGRSVDAIVCPSPALERELLQRGAPAERVHFVPNGIDFGRYRHQREKLREGARARLGIEPGVPVIVAFLWDWRIKGGELLLDAIWDAIEEIGPLRAILVTKDPLAAGAVEAHGLSGLTRLIEPVEDVTELYAAADAFIAPSRAEGGTPFAVLEALASGLPVVASDIPAHRYIAIRSTGMSISDRDPSQFGSAIATALDRSSPIEVELSESFSIERWNERMLELYEAVVSETR